MSFRDPFSPGRFGTRSACKKLKLLRLHLSLCCLLLDSDWGTGQRQITASCELERKRGTGNCIVGSYGFDRFLTRPTIILGMHFTFHLSGRNRISPIFSKNDTEIYFFTAVLGTITHRTQVFNNCGYFLLDSIHFLLYLFLY